MFLNRLIITGISLTRPTDLRLQLLSKSMVYFFKIFGLRSHGARISPLHQDPVFLTEWGGQSGYENPISFYFSDFLVVILICFYAIH